MERENHSHQIDPEKRKCMRFMQVGLSCILAWPVAIMLAAMYGLESMVPIMSVLMVVIGAVIFTIGYVGKQELAERRRAEKPKPPDCTE
jgi:membrane protein YdbS with pleckstrin-like domain